MNDKFKGTGVALVTPFSQDGSIDYDGLSNLIEHVIAGGVDYLVSLGTTGESATLSNEEKAEVLAFTVEKTAKRLPVVGGFGGNNTQEIIDSVNNASLEGVDAILSVSPYYSKPTQNGIYAHYMALAENSPLPIIIYNVPARTASNITADTTLRLATDSDKFLGIKEASGDLIQCMDIVNKRPNKNFLVISGEDALTLPMTSFGMDGVISVIANALPNEFAGMTRSSLKGEFKEATALHFQLLETIKMIFTEGNPGGIKALLEIMGVCNSTMRLPLAPISKELYSKLELSVKKITVS